MTQWWDPTHSLETLLINEINPESWWSMWYEGRKNLFIVTFTVMTDVKWSRNVLIMCLFLQDTQYFIVPCFVYYSLYYILCILWINLCTCYICVSRKTCLFWKIHVAHKFFVMVEHFIVKYFSYSNFEYINYRTASMRQWDEEMKKRLGTFPHPKFSPIIGPADYPLVIKAYASHQLLVAFQNPQTCSTLNVP